MDSNNVSNTTSMDNSRPARGYDAFAMTMLALILLNIIFHSMGCYLLFRLYKNGRENVQQIYLINLSITHTLGNVFQLISRILLMMDNKEPLPGKVNLYIVAMLLTVFTFSYYMSMAYITVDKGLDILLNIKYPVYWNEYKAKHLVYATWILGVCMCMCVLMAHQFGRVTIDDIGDVLFLYIYPTFDFSFIVLAVICYSFLFHKYKQARIVPGSMRYKNGKNCMRAVNGQGKLVSTSAFRIFQTSRFYISVLLIFTFLVFMVLPNLVYLFYGVLGGHKSKTLDDALLILFNFSYLLDAWIYIFAQNSVRNLLRRTMYSIYNNRRWLQNSINTRCSIQLQLTQLATSNETTELAKEIPKKL